MSDASSPGPTWTGPRARARRVALAFAVLFAVASPVSAAPEPSPERERRSSTPSGDPPRRAAVPPKGAPADAAGRVHLKVVDGADARLRSGRLTGAAGAAVEAVLGDRAAARRRLFQRPEAALDRDRRAVEGRGRRGLADLRLWFEVEVAGGEDLDAVVADLAALAVVEDVYAAPVAVPPPVATPDFTGLQTYRGPAPGGVDIAHAATVPGGGGQNVVIADVEYSWDVDHEDVARARAPGAVIANGVPDDPFADTDHGTGVIGVLSADVNGFGVSGSAPAAGLRMVNAYSSDGYMLANAIDLASAALDPGDVILVEQQAADTTGAYVPVEHVPAFRDAIAAATAAGIVVVAAAGNGGQDLDDHGAFLPGGGFDTGSVVVGAGGPDGCGLVPRERLFFSNFGARVDVQAWGACVATAGAGNLFLGDGDPHRAYTDTFSGTSSASAIVAAAAASVSSAAQAQGVVLTPRQVRAILQATGTPQATGGGAPAGHVGPLPDLERALAWLDPCPADDDFEVPVGEVARPLSGASAGGALCGADVDRFTVTAAAGDEIGVDLAFDHALGDLTLALVDPGGTLVAVAVSTTDDEHLRFVAPGAGTYEVLVVGGAGVENTYTVRAAAFRRPPNDDFAAASLLAGPSGSVAGSNEGASLEAGEPVTVAGAPASNSVWYRWTAPAPGRLVVDTVGSDYDTTLAVYRGGAVDALTVVGANDDFGGGMASRVGPVDVDAGTTYRIRVDGWSGATGDHSLQWSFTPVVVVPGGAGVVEGNTGTRTVLVPVTLSTPADRTVSVQWATYDAVAQPQAGVDYISASGTVMFAPGQTQRTVSVTVRGDTLDEDDEWIVVAFSNPTHATIGGFYGLGIGVILDDDPPPVVVPGGSGVLEGDSGTRILSVPVQLSAPSGRTVTVAWSTLDTQAQPQVGVDYLSASGTVTFAPGQTQRTVPVTVRGDTAVEGDEWIVVVFSNPTNATIGGFYGLGIGVIVNDD